MYRRAFARHRTGAALLLGLSLRAPSASAEPAQPDETRVGTVEGKAAEELPSAAETPPIPAASIVASRLIRDEGVADAQRALTRADGSLALPALRTGTATVPVESHRHLAQQTNVQLVPGDEARVSLALGPRVELPGVTEAALEVTVRGQRSAPGVSSHTREEVHRMLGAFGDPFRAEEALRVTPVASRLPYFYVRGAPPGNVGYFLDRVRVPYRGLLPALLSLFSPEVKLDYRDYQARASYEPSARDRSSVFGFGSYDLLSEKRTGILRRLGDACRPRITFTW